MTRDLERLINKGEDFQIRTPSYLFKYVKDTLKYEVNRGSMHNHFKTHFFDVVNYNPLKPISSDYVDYLKYLLFAEINPKEVDFFWGSTPQEQDIIRVRFRKNRLLK